MSIEDILQTEKENKDCIFLYRQDDGWYAYEQSAFFCYSLLGIVDIVWISSDTNGGTNSDAVRVRISEPNKFLYTPLLKVISKKKTQYIISCRISCGGFSYWRREQEMKCRILQSKEVS